MTAGIGHREPSSPTPAGIRGRRLPPLDALRAFEAAARHRSFTRAADEIGVTQAAVSHRVRELELLLDARLFHRLTRRVELTDRGEFLAAAVQRGLDRIAEGLANLQPDADLAGPLRISILPSFAQRWLMPRLARFRALHPEIEVRVMADDGLSDLRAGAADLAIRFGRGVYPGLDSTFLMGDAVLPVCSPGFRQRLGPDSSLEALLRQPLLHDSACAGYASGEDWPDWLAAVGRPELRCDTGQRFSDAVLTLGAAAAGLGLALGRRSLLGEDLATGRLVSVWPAAAAPTAFSYWLVCLPEWKHSRRLAAFRDWVLAESRAFAAACAEAHRNRAPS